MFISGGPGAARHFNRRDGIGGRLDTRLIPFSFAVGFFSPVVAIVCAVFFYVRHCAACPNPETRISAVAYILALIICATIAFFFGLHYGIAWACSSGWGGNLCGLVGFFFTGPTAAALAIFLVSVLLVCFRG
jgi:hypothetical protein